MPRQPDIVASAPRGGRECASRKVAFTLCGGRGRPRRAAFADLRWGTIKPGVLTASLIVSALFTGRSWAGSLNIVGRFASQAFLAIQSWTSRQAYPRAPPIQVAIPTCNLVGCAH